MEELTKVKSEIQAVKDVPMPDGEGLEKAH